MPASLCVCFAMAHARAAQMLALVISRMEVTPMTSIIVRGLDESVKKNLAAQAKAHGRSMEAEVREILTRAAQPPHIGVALLSAAQEVGGVEDLALPARSDAARAADLK